eukprot:3932968-Rhodomonas_salina.1
MWEACLGRRGELDGDPVRSISMVSCWSGLRWSSAGASSGVTARVAERPKPVTGVVEPCPSREIAAVPAVIRVPSDQRRCASQSRSSGMSR